jgi:hypothetical protein
VIKHIYETLARDEARHGGAYLRYMKKALTRFGNEAKAAFSKVGVLMASARRTAQALHPTNLHVNATLFPRDTIQSRVPDPQWLEGWLDKQIQFDDIPARMVSSIARRSFIKRRMSDQTSCSRLAGCPPPASVMVVRGGPLAGYRSQTCLCNWIFVR